MGCGAAVARPTTSSKNPSTRAGQRTKIQIQASEGLILFVILFFFPFFSSSSSFSFVIEIYNKFI